MQRPLKLLIIGLVIVAGVLAYLMFRPSREQVFMDLVAGLPNAKLLQPSPETFSVVSATLAGDTKQAIHPKEQSRARWEFTVPDDAWFAFSLGIMPEGWDVPGDGVLFAVGVSDMAGDYQEVFSATVNPNGNPGDRRWHPLMVDLSPYAGKRVELILNTRASPPPPPGLEARADKAGDLPLWGEPRIIIR